MLRCRKADMECQGHCKCGDPPPTAEPITPSCPKYLPPNANPGLIDLGDDTLDWLQGHRPEEEEEQSSGPKRRADRLIRPSHTIPAMSAINAKMHICYNYKESKYLCIYVWHSITNTVHIFPHSTKATVNSQNKLPRVLSILNKTIQLPQRSGIKPHHQHKHTCSRCLVSP